MSDETIRFRVLGPLEVEQNGRRLEPSAPRQRALLSLFLMLPGEPVSVDRVIDRLWGEEAPSGGAKTVGFHLSKLRDALEPDREKGTDGSIIRTTQAGYVLDVDPAAIDSRRFEGLLDEARSVVAADPGKAAALARDALSLWRGPAHADVAYEEFAQEEIRRLEERRLEATEARIEADLALGRHADVVPDLERLVEQYPLREAMRSSLMLALYRAGRQADALRAYEAGRRTLAEELGIDPSHELQDLERRILEQDRSLDLPSWAVPTGRAPSDAANPYKGLRAFEEGDAPDFFGRAALIADVLDRLGSLGAGALLALVGPSGSGKSSLLNAGLLPAIRRGAIEGSDRWVIARMRPGTRPMEELEVALLRAAPEAPGSVAGLLGDSSTGLRKAIRLLVPDDDAAGVLLVIDQFEELWTVSADDERSSLLAALASTLEDRRGQLRVVIGLRSDFLGDPLREEWLAQRLRDGTVLVPPMNADEITDVVTRPAERVDVTVEPDLTAAVVRDLHANAGALPLLQYSLTQAFENRATDEVLTRADYEATGGLQKALADGAEETFAALSRQRRDVTRQVLLRLVSPRRGTTGVRRRVPVAEIERLGLDAGDLTAVLGAFDEARLLSFGSLPGTGGPTVEVAHESLLTAWERLTGWITEAQDDLAAHRLLQDLTQDWEEGGRETESLLSGGRLARFAEFAGATSVLLSDSEAAFVEASIEAAKVATTRQRRLRRRVIATVSGIAVVAIVLAVVALVARNRADDQARQAGARALIADAYEALEQDPRLALFLAAAAAELEPGAEAAGPLQQAINAQTLEYSFESSSFAVAVAAEHGLVATLAEGGFVEIRDVSTGEIVHRLAMQMATSTQVNDILGTPEFERPRLAFDDSGTYIFGVSTQGEVRVATLPTGSAPDDPRLGNLGRRDLNPGLLSEERANAGFALAVVPGRPAVDVISGDCSGHPTGESDPLTGLCVARFGLDGAVDARPAELTNVPIAVTSAAHIGESLLIGTSAGLVDAAAATQAEDPPPWSAVVAVSPSGTGAVSLDNRQIEVRDGDGSTVDLPGDGNVRALGLDVSGNRLAVGHEDGSITIWEVGEAQRIASIVTSGGLITDLEFGGRHGDRVVVALGRQIEVHRIEEGRLIDGRSEGMFVVETATSPDGSILAFANNDGSVDLIDADTGSLKTKLQVDGVSVTFDDDGFLLIGTRLGAVAWHRPDTWQLERSIQLARPLEAGRDSPITPLAAGPGSLIAYGLDGFSAIPNADIGALNILDASEMLMVDTLSAAGGLDSGGASIVEPTTAAWHRLSEVLLLGSNTGGLRGTPVPGDPLINIPMRGAVTQLVTVPVSSVVLVPTTSGAVAAFDFEDESFLAYVSSVDPSGVTVAMDPQARWFATGGSGTNTVQLWDLESGEALATLWSGPGGISEVWFTSDGARVGFLDDRGQVGFVDTNTTALLARAHELLASLGPPSPVECLTYFDRVDCSDAVTLP